MSDFKRTGGIKRSLLTKEQKEDYFYSYDIHTMFTNDLNNRPFNTKETPSKYRLNTNFNPNTMTKALFSNYQTQKTPTTGGISMALDVTNIEPKTEQDANKILAQIAHNIQVERTLKECIERTLIGIYLVGKAKKDPKKIVRYAVIMPFPFVSDYAIESGGYDKTKTFWENFKINVSHFKIRGRKPPDDEFEIISAGIGPRFNRYPHQDIYVETYFRQYARHEDVGGNAYQHKSQEYVFGETLAAEINRLFWGRTANASYYLKGIGDCDIVEIFNNSNFSLPLYGYILPSNNYDLPSFYAPSSFSQATLIEMFSTNNSAFGWRDYVLKSPPVTVTDVNYFPLEFYAFENTNSSKELILHDLCGMLIIEIVGSGDHRLNDQNTTFTSAFHVVFNGNKLLYAEKLGDIIPNPQLLSSQTPNTDLTIEIISQNRHGDPYPYSSRQNWMTIKLFIFKGSISNIFSI